MARLAIVISALFVCCTLANAQTTQQYYNTGYTYVPPTNYRPWQYDGSISGGYSNVQFSHHGDYAPYSRDGGYIDANLNFKLPNLDAPTVGVGVTASGYWDSYTDGFYALYSDLSLIEFEGRVAFPISFFRKDNGFFVSPDITSGFLLESSATQYPFYTTYHNGGGFEIRPGVRVGYRIGKFSAGMEGSYMFAWGSFGPYGDTAEEGRVGLFVAYRF